jgi:hypothetical protein
MRQRRPRGGWGTVLGILGVLGARCGPTPLPPGPSSLRICTPGVTASCVCASGSAGRQVCNFDGTAYGSCGDCGGTTPGCSASNPSGTCPVGQACVGGMCMATGPQPCSPSNPTGTCPGGQTCSGGTCITPTVPCSPANPAGACIGEQTCVGGACCDVTQACGAVCCNSGSVCVQDASGNRVCAQRCTTNSECSASSGGCCRALVSTGGTALGYGACGSFVAGMTACLCARPTDCGSGGGCTPVVGTDGVPRRPYVCTSDTCGPYGHCTGILGACPNGYCNLCDAAGNCFCAQVCTSEAMCGGAACSTYARSNGSCPNTQRACTAR